MSTRFIGKYPEVDLKDIHFCMISNCPADEFNVLTTFSISVPRELLSNVITEINALRQSCIEAKDDDEWEIIIRKVDKSPQKPKTAGI